MIKIMTDKEKILKYLDSKGISKNKFYIKTGLSVGFLDSGSSLGVDKLKLIIDNYHDLNLEWFFNEKAPMLRTEAETIHVKPSENVENEEGVSKSKNLAVDFTPRRQYSLKQFFKEYYSSLNYNVIDNKILEKQLMNLTTAEKEMIAHDMELNYDDFEQGIEAVVKKPSGGKIVPVYETVAAAGSNTVELSGSRASWVNVGDVLKDSECAIYIYGNSMIPGYPSGSLMGLCALNEPFIEPGNVYVIETSSNRYIKRLYYNEDKTALLCVSDNHIKHADGPLEGTYIYPPFEIPFSSVKIIYRVTGVVKRNSNMML